MNPTHTWLANSIALACLASLPQAFADIDASAPDHVGAIAELVGQIQESVAQLHDARADARQRVVRLEMQLRDMEREFQREEAANLRNDMAWAQPALVDSVIDVSEANAVPSLEIADDVEASPIVAESGTPATTLAELTATSPLDESLAVNDAALNEMRGGFLTGNGLQISFGIERAIYINGALVTVTSLNIIDLTRIAVALNPAVPTTIASTEGIAALASGAGPSALQQTVAALSDTLSAAAPPATSAAAATSPAETANSVAVSPSVSDASVAAATTTNLPTATVPQTTSTSTSASTSAQSAPAVVATSPVTVTTGSVALIQSGDGNLAPANVVLPSALGAIIQNSLDNQKIQTVTVVNATVNSLEILKSQNLHSSISAAVADSLKR
jgi:hypothetical protein